MGYRDLQQRRIARAWRQRWRRRKGLTYALAVAYGLAAIVAGALLLGLFERDQPPTAPADAVAITFGFDRDPITRTVTTDVQGFATPLETPAEATLTARMGSDLRNEDFAAEFPAEQITLGVTRLTGMRISLAITANPWTPERVRAGIYSGVVEIRGTDATADVPVQIYLRTRDYKWAMLAFLLIFLGASLGLLVKWITENLTAQAAMMRRLAFLKHAIGYGQDGTNLPVSVRMSIDDLEDQITRQDYARVEEGFKAIDSERMNLAEVASRFDGLYDQLAGQSALVDSHGRLPTETSLLVNGVLDAEYRDLLEIQAIPWPKRQADIVDQTAVLRRNFAGTYNVLFDYLQKPSERLRPALAALQEGDYSRALEIYEHYKAEEWASSRDQEQAGRDGSELTPPMSGPTHLNDRAIGRSYIVEDRQGLAWIFRRARIIAAVASVLVVSLVGLKVEYLDSQSFDGSLTTWLTLGLWGLVVELSGLSILDVVGRLGSSAAGATPVARA